MLTTPSQAQRDADEEGDYMAFEQLMADAQLKKEKKKDKDHHHPGKKEDNAATAAGAGGGAGVGGKAS